MPSTGTTIPPAKTEGTISPKPPSNPSLPESLPSGRHHSRSQQQQHTTDSPLTDNARHDNGFHAHLVSSSMQRPRPGQLDGVLLHGGDVVTPERSLSPGSVAPELAQRVGTCHRHGQSVSPSMSESSKSHGGASGGSILHGTDNADPTLPRFSCRGDDFDGVTPSTGTHGTSSGYDHPVSKEHGSSTTSPQERGVRRSLSSAESGGTPVVIVNTENMLNATTGSVSSDTRREVSTASALSMTSLFADPRLIDDDYLLRSMTTPNTSMSMAHHRSVSYDRIGGSFVSGDINETLLLESVNALKASRTSPSRSPQTSKHLTPHSSVAQTPPLTPHEDHPSTSTFATISKRQSTFSTRSGSSEGSNNSQLCDAIGTPKLSAVSFKPDEMLFHLDDRHYSNAIAEYLTPSMMENGDGVPPFAAGPLSTKKNTNPPVSLSPVLDSFAFAEQRSNTCVCAGQCQCRAGDFFFNFLPHRMQQEHCTAQSVDAVDRHRNVTTNTVKTDTHQAQSEQCGQQQCGGRAVNVGVEKPTSRAQEESKSA